jgi:hypothetical protein
VESLSSSKSRRDVAGMAWTATIRRHRTKRPQARPGG